MNYFYTTRVEARTAFLDETESRHALKVLRMKKGDPIWLVDGQGHYYKGIIEDTGSGKCLVEIRDQKAEEPPKRPYLHLIIAPTKQSGRFEWFLEKVTEIGVDEISPILCEHSERKKLNLQRSGRILISAMKQSGRATLPLLNALQDFGQVLDKHNRETQLTVAQHGGLSLEEILAGSPRSLALFIGPEGDFSGRELEMLQERGAKKVGLGSYRLRTETAGIVASTIVNKT